MTRLDPFIVRRTDTVRTAMEKIDANKHRVVVVLDEERHVLGTVSDGDIRRAFLKDVLPIAPVEQVMNLNCRTTTERNAKRLAEALRREKVTVLPVVDDQNRLLDLALAYEPFTDPGANGGRP